MELNEYIAPLRKWWWLIVAATLVAAGASYAASLQQASIYQARTTLVIGRAIDNPNPSGNEFWLTQQLAQTYAEIAKMEPIRAATMTALGLTWLPEFTVRAVPNTQLIEISVSDTIPVRSQAVANELARQLILQSPTSSEQDEQSRQIFINEQLDDLEQKIRETEAEISAKQDELADAVSARQIADVQSQIAALENKRITLQSNYTNLLATTQRGAINTLSIIEPAALPTVPIGPNTMTTLLVAASIGFTLAAGAAYLLEYLDDTVKTPDEVRRLTGLPTLAGIARIPDEDEDKLITLTEPRNPTSEAYRVLRTGIQFSAIDNPDKAVILVTSANPGEGKSVTVANLAVVMAQAGNDVIVVDADLRRPVQHKLFDLTKNRGLTSFLLETQLSSPEPEVLAALERAVQLTSVDGLSILASGTNPPNPSELLGSAKMEQLIDFLGRHYDYVIIDSPPVLAVTDAVVLSRRSSGVLLVADARSTRRVHIRQAVDHLKAGTAHIVGVVLNRLSPRTDGYYSYYYQSEYYLDDGLDSEEVGDGQPVNRAPLRRRSSKEVASEVR
jgi:polysaccharide biosynthesis transport protein